MDDLSCPYCRDGDCENVAVVQSSRTKPSTAKIPLRKTGILCQNDEIKANLEHKLDLPCPICDKVQQSHKLLKKHFHDKHGNKMYCKVCLSHDYVFTNELDVYTHKEFAAHTASQHATCPFCDWIFYSNKELSKHCKTQHESCFICERDDPEHPQYFPQYASLKDHFMAKHFMCMVPQCLEDKFIVFGSKLELQNHMLEQHKSLIDVKQMQRIDPSDLDAIRSKKIQHDTNEQTKRRYTERLRINAKGDHGLIDQIWQANHTFQTKKVPVDIFIGTYGSVLAADKDEITVLLEEFARFAELNDNKRQQLDTALIHRRPTPAAASPGASTPNGPKPVQRSAASSWLGRKSTGSPGPVNVANLPRLGDARRPDYLSAPTRIAVKPKPKVKPSLQALPQSAGPSWGGGPQTRLPSLGAPGSTRPSWMDASPRPSASPSASSSASTSARGSPSSTPSTSARPSAHPSAANLPSLPSAQKAKQNAKTKKIVRIV